MIELETKNNRPTSEPMMINFVKEDKRVGNKEKITNLTDNAKEGEVSVDLKNKLVFPNAIQTTLRPDIVV